MQKSNFPDEGIAGGLYGLRFACSQREIQSPVDPASFESYVELMRQGAAASARVAAAARILQREAHRTSLTAKAAMGALYKAGEDPFRLLNIQFTVPFKGKVMAEGDHVILHQKKFKEWRTNEPDNAYTGDGNEEEEKIDPKEEMKKKAKKKLNLLKKMKEMARKNKKKLIIAAAVAGAAAAIGTASAIEKTANKKKKAKEPPKEEPPPPDRDQGGGYGVNGGTSTPNSGQKGGSGVNSGSSNQSSGGGGYGVNGGVPSDEKNRNNSGHQQVHTQGMLMDAGLGVDFNSAVASTALVAVRGAISQHAAASFMAARESESSWQQRKARDTQSLKCFL